MTDSFDNILTKLGTGRWQILHYLLLSYWFSCAAYQTLGSAFLAPDIGHECIVPPEGKYIISSSLIESGALSDANYSSKEIYRINEEKRSASQCSYNIENNVTGELEEEKCTSWEYDHTTFTATATEEFNLVCGRRIMQADYQSIYMCGILFGSVINGYVSDRYGRFKVIMTGALLFSVFSTILTWLPTIPLIFAVRFIVGFMQPMALFSGFIMVMEISEPKARTAVGMSIMIGWSSGTILLGGFGYLIRDWRWLQLAISLPSFLFLPSFWLLDESPRWLVVNGKFDKAMEVLKRAARWNKAELGPEEEMLTVMKAVYKEREAEDNTENSLSKRAASWLKEAIILFRTPKLRKITLIMYFDFFVVAMVYFGLGLAGGSFKVNQFAYMAISGLSEVPAHTFGIPFVKWFGNRMSLVLSFFITGVCMLILPFISEDYHWFAVTLSMIGKMTTTAIFAIVGVYGSDLFPTEVRNRGIGSSMMCSRVGGMITPYLLGVFGVSIPWVNPVIFGLCSLVAGLVSLMLQETRGSIQPDTIRRLEGYDNPVIIGDATL